MKHLTITVLLLSSLSSFGQLQYYKDLPTDILEQLDNMGVDGSPLLNSYEGMCLNEIYKDSLKGFDFAGKKVGFWNMGPRDKADYFNDVKDRYHRNGTTIGGTAMYVFDAAQKAESGGYDAAIVYWSKFRQPLSR